ncbi:T9SS type A sorting domain-containing protein [Flagellimonas crocea]|uniref:T9SS type A sorting domain-containing protein n=1 Tax=Flagellimonas crocea TaxID=3067311 RepID=UPI00296F7076|nr:T9SS type A sorting domain-containing protein [Muricauda sp. DH64]
MKVRLLLLFLVFSPLLSAQQKLKFTYDTSGNQILRDRVCATCLKAVLPKENDSLQAMVDEDALTVEEAMDRMEIVAAPNPVTDLLTVDWTVDPQLVPTSIHLFTVDNRMLKSFNIRRRQLEQQFEFSNYPPGMYIIQVHFNSGKWRSFKIIKR